MKHIAIFGSGSGSNAENIIVHFKVSKKAKVSLILSNRADAYILERARRNNIPFLAFSHSEFNETDGILDLLKEQNIDMVILAGFLKLIPKSILTSFSGHIINIHPALLPDFGGKGLYGSKVHSCVIDSRAILSGITIHHVNEHFDGGEIIFQAACHVDKEDDVEKLQSKIRQLELRYYPLVIDKLIGS
jgi:phosphoribosylglycinamide formyltransferase-1